MSKTGIFWFSRITNQKSSLSLHKANCFGFTGWKSGWKRGHQPLRMARKPECETAGKRFRSEEQRSRIQACSCQPIDINLFFLLCCSVCRWCCRGRSWSCSPDLQSCTCCKAFLDEPREHGTRVQVFGAMLASPNAEPPGAYCY